MAAESKLEWRGPEALAKIRHAAMKGLFAAAEAILTKANDDVPHDQGHLMRSGHVSTNEASLEAAVSYNTPYAARLHEHPEYNFQDGRKGKWLEDVVQKDGPGLMQKKVANNISAALK
jgi:hypothetical protein